MLRNNSKDNICVAGDAFHPKLGHGGCYAMELRLF